MGRGDCLILELRGWALHIWGRVLIRGWGQPYSSKFCMHIFSLKLIALVIIVVLWSVQALCPAAKRLFVLDILGKCYSGIA